MKELTIDACVDSLPPVLAFVDAELEAADCPLETQMQIDLAIEEIFTNIAHYAYGPEGGKATLRMEVSEDPASATITFLDHGIPYNPLAKEDPDVTLPTKQRKIGGLGIFMTKKLMDDLSYEYKDGQNIIRQRRCRLRPGALGQLMSRPGPTAPGPGVKEEKSAAKQREGYPVKKRRCLKTVYCQAGVERRHR